MADAQVRTIRMLVYGAYLVLLMIVGPGLYRDTMATTLWLTPLVLAAMLGNGLLPRNTPARWALFGVDAIVITASAILREGAEDPALLLWFPVLMLQAGRTDRRAVLGALLVGLVGVGTLVVLDGPSAHGVVVFLSLFLAGVFLWLTTNRGRALTDRLDQRQRELERLSFTFSRYFSPQVAQLLAEQGQAALATGRRDVSVLFADLSGFTRFTEMSSAEVVVGTLGEYLDELCRVALHFDGTLDKFMGDELMVVWNAPIAQTDHARRALACARDMLLVMDMMNQERALRGDPVLGLSIGINSGEAVVGHIGGQDRVQYTVIGDTVNVAKRLQGAANAGEIVAGVETVLAAGESPRATEELRLKGRSHEVTAVRLGGRSRAA